jgi:hypothetical protein
MPRHLGWAFLNEAANDDTIRVTTFDLDYVHPDDFSYFRLYRQVTLVSVTDSLSVHLACRP